MEYNRGRLGRGQLHVLIALARGSGCMMHTILGGLLNACVLLTMFYSCPAIWLNAALSNSSICMCLLIMICLFIHLAALLACFFNFAKKCSQDATPSLDSFQLISLSKFTGSKAVPGQHFFQNFGKAHCAGVISVILPYSHPWPIIETEGPLLGM